MLQCASSIAVCDQCCDVPAVSAADMRSKNVYCAIFNFCHDFYLVLFSKQCRFTIFSSATEIGLLI